jgi:hypothetical protein
MGYSRFKQKFLTLFSTLRHSRVRLQESALRYPFFVCRQRARL